MTADVSAAGSATRVLSTEVVVLGAATLAVWGHTVDELRIGQFVAVPLGIVTLGLLGAWSRLRPATRGAAALLLGSVWALAVVPYHLVPLLEGAVTWQNVSGLLRIAGGVPMAVLGLRELRRR
jgi:hypothetical protein